MSFIVAIVGRPNGKINPFQQDNREISIVDDKPGVTRDKYMVKASGRQEFTLVDTGGIEPSAKVILNQMKRQAVLPSIPPIHFCLWLTEKTE